MRRNIGGEGAALVVRLADETDVAEAQVCLLYTSDAADE